MLQYAACRGGLQAQRKRYRDPGNENMSVSTHPDTCKVHAQDEPVDKTGSPSATTAILIIGDVFGNVAQTLQVSKCIFDTTCLAALSLHSPIFSNKGRRPPCLRWRKLPPIPSLRSRLLAGSIRQPHLVSTRHTRKTASHRRVLRRPCEFWKAQRENPRDH